MPKTPDTFLRRLSKQHGRRAENAAALWLRIKGYRILARRVGAPGGEIDLIAAKKAVLVFLEVRSSATKDPAPEAGAPDHRRSIEQAARLWLAGRPKLHNHVWRFDIVVLAPGRLPRHRRDAWRAES